MEEPTPTSPTSFKSPTSPTSPTSSTSRQPLTLLSLPRELRTIISLFVHQDPTYIHVSPAHKAGYPFGLAHTNRQLRRETLQLFNDYPQFASGSPHLLYSSSQLSYGSPGLVYGSPRTFVFYVASRQNLQFAIDWVYDVGDDMLAATRRFEIRRNVHCFSGSQMCRKLVIDLTAPDTRKVRVEPGTGWEAVDTCMNVKVVVIKSLNVVDFQRVMDRRSLVEILYRVNQKGLWGMWNMDGGVQGECCTSQWGTRF